MQYVLQELHDGTELHEHRVRAVACLVKIYRAFKDNGLFLERDVALGAMEDLRVFYEHYHWLACHAVDNGEMNYAVKQKMHTLFHIVDHSKYLNPRFTWCYAYEDFMGTVVTCARACVAGSPMHIVGKKVLDNFLLVLSLPLSEG